MNRVLIGLLALWAAACAAADLPPGTNAIPSSAGTNDPVEAEYEKLLAADDAAQEEVDQWIKENQAFAEKGAGVPPAELARRIRDRFESVRRAYDTFIGNHPNHARARVAYGSFLNDTHDEDGAQTQWEKARAIDPSNPAVWNNLANFYGHAGPVKKAFEYYGKAIELNPEEPIYYHNFGTTVYLFRVDAKEFFNIDEQQVFDKALDLYAHAIRLDPTNFPLATDIAQTYYGIKPTRTEDALISWTNALKLAHDDFERQGVYLHFARIKLNAGRFPEAHAHLDAVDDPRYKELKARLVRNLDAREHPSASTNAPPTAPGTNSPAAAGAKDPP